MSGLTEIDDALDRLERQQKGNSSSSVHATAVKEFLRTKRKIKDKDGKITEEFDIALSDLPDAHSFSIFELLSSHFGYEFGDGTPDLDLTFFAEHYAKNRVPQGRKSRLEALQTFLASTEYEKAEKELGIKDLVEK